MPFSLPTTLFAQHRLREESELVFRLTDTFRTSLLQGSNAPLPTNLPDSSLSPVLATPDLAHSLLGLQGHFIRLDDSAALTNRLIDRIILMARQSPDGCIAAILLNVYQTYTTQHAVNCAMLAARLADELAMEETDRRALIGAALTMNLGSCDLQNQLAMQDGPPSTAQRQVLELHPLISSAILHEAGIDDPVWHMAVLLHHEQHNGRGYPFGVTAEQISVLADMLRLIDITTAQLMPRSYRSSIDAKHALARLYAGAKDNFDPAHITQLIKILGIYPPGSFVELENGERALVIKGGASAAAPVVIGIRQPHDTFDTSQSGFHVNGSIAMRVETRLLPLFARYWQ